MKKFNRFTVTSALPYANGPIHIGQLAGAYIPADIYVRYLRLKGEDVVFICGSDEHGMAITLQAIRSGQSPQEIIDRYHTLNKDSFEEFGISFDIFHRTSDQLHHETAASFFKKLNEKGEFEEKESEQFFDREYSQFLADRYIMGTCPRCGNNRAYGDQCENCGSTLSPAELIDPRSTLSGQTPVLKKTKHWYLPLDRYENWLKKWILEDHTEWKKNVYGQCRSWLDHGLQPRAMTRDLDWGVKVPLENTAGKVLYVWLDAPIGYISATKAWADNNGKDWRPYWQAEDTRLIHFIGKDNIVFHCIIFPIILKAHGDYILPDNVPANEFMNMEGDKISTSRNWAVWLHEFLQEFPGKQDVLRYVLTANMPETKDSEFTWKDFQERNNSELVANLGNFVNRVMVLTQKYFDGVVPHYSELSDTDNALLHNVAQVYKNVAVNIEQFRFREALSECMGLARVGNKYLADEEPWKAIKTDPERVKSILYVANQLVAHLGILCSPFLPGSSEAICKMIGLGSIAWQAGNEPELLKPGTRLSKPVLLFEKIEDHEVEAQIAKLKQTQTGNNKAESETDQSNEQNSIIKDTIAFDDFAKMDICAGTILEAGKVEKADRLLKLSVDLGDEIRIIISGIAEHFKPEELTGRQVCVLANLEPRKIKGILSQGMILMAEGPDGKLSLVVPDSDVANGAQVG